MGTFIIQPHGRLNDWVAEEMGYFQDEGLDYFLNVDASHWKNGGRGWDWTSAPYDVNVVLSRWATRPLIDVCILSQQSSHLHQMAGNWQEGGSNGIAI